MEDNEMQVGNIMKDKVHVIKLKSLVRSRVYSSSTDIQEETSLHFGNILIRRECTLTLILSFFMSSLIGTNTLCDSIISFRAMKHVLRDR